jgi:DNA-directed RNA polymerase subunit RPC12/RpoP
MMPNKILLVLMAMAFITGLGGCGKSDVDQALDSDANGYVCAKCSAKFYTARTDFAQVCPSCKSYEIQEVEGFVCLADNEVVLGPRGLRSVRCPKCGSPTTGRIIPKESGLTAWGATKRTLKEVSAGN